MQGKDLRVTEKFKQMVSQKVKVLELRVFGSRARGDATEESDLDVFIVVDSLDRSIEKYISECAWEVGFHEDVLIMPVTVSIETVKHSPLSESLFIKNVYREGVAV